jgi:putative membrane protein
MNALLTYLKGIAMGAADVVPGVSGGTIAYLTGIYQRLLDAIHAAGGSMWVALRRDGIAAAWKAVDGWFLLALLGGIGTSVVSLSKLVLWGLESHPLIVWSFFLGLILASLRMLARDLNGSWIALIVGTALGFILSSMPAGRAELSPVFTFFAGFLAICAMILPGISGSFILVLLGAYEPVLESIHERDLATIAIFGTGAILGLLTFGRLLRWLFQRFERVTVALMTGFIAGSLTKVWPFRGTRGGWELPISPGAWQLETGLDIPWLGIVTAVALGAALVLGLDAWAQSRQPKS